VAVHGFLERHVQVVEARDAAVVAAQGAEHWPLPGGVQDAVDDHVEAVADPVVTPNIGSSQGRVEM